MSLRCIGVEIHGKFANSPKTENTTQLNDEKQD